MFPGQNQHVLYTLHWSKWLLQAQLQLCSAQQIKLRRKAMLSQSDFPWPAWNISVTSWTMLYPYPTSRQLSQHQCHPSNFTGWRVSMAVIYHSQQRWSNLHSRSLEDPSGASSSAVHLLTHKHPLLLQHLHLIWKRSDRQQPHHMNPANTEHMVACWWIGTQPWWGCTLNTGFSFEPLPTSRTLKF